MLTAVPPIVRDVVHAAIYVRTRVVPAAEHRFRRLDELYFRILREIHALILAVVVFEKLYYLFKIFRRKFGIGRIALFLLYRVEYALVDRLVLLHDDVREHLYETTVRVVCETRVMRFCRKPFHRFVVQSEVENGIHHARHGRSRSATDGHEQGVLFVAQLLAHLRFEIGEGVEYLLADILVYVPSVLVILRARFRRDRKSRRNRKTEIGHFRKVRTLAAEKFAHLAVTFIKPVNEFFTFFSFIID